MPNRLAELADIEPGNRFEGLGQIEPVSPSNRLATLQDQFKAPGNVFNTAPPEIQGKINESFKTSGLGKKDKERFSVSMYLGQELDIAPEWVMENYDAVSEGFFGEKTEPPKAFKNLIKRFSPGEARQFLNPDKTQDSRGFADNTARNLAVGFNQAAYSSVEGSLRIVNQTYARAFTEQQELLRERLVIEDALTPIENTLRAIGNEELQQALGEAGILDPALSPETVEKARRAAQQFATTGLTPDDVGDEKLFERFRAEELQNLSGKLQSGEIILPDDARALVESRIKSFARPDIKLPESLQRLFAKTEKLDILQLEKLRGRKGEINTRLDEIYRNKVGQYADAVREFRQYSTKVYDVDPEFAESIHGQVVSGIGQMGFQIPASVIPVAGQVAITSQLFQEGFDQAYEATGDNEFAFQAGSQNSAGAILEYAGIKDVTGLMFAAVKKGSALTVKEIIKRAAMTGLAAGAAEGTTEFNQTMWMNYVANTLSGFDPQRELTQGVFESFVVGAMTGQTVSTTASGLNLTMERRAANRTVVTGRNGGMMEIDDAKRLKEQMGGEGFKEAMDGVANGDLLQRVAEGDPDALKAYNETLVKDVSLNVQKDGPVISRPKQTFKRQGATLDVTEEGKFMVTTAEGAQIELDPSKTATRRLIDKFTGGAMSIDAVRLPGIQGEVDKYVSEVGSHGIKITVEPRSPVMKKKTEEGITRIKPDAIFDSTTGEVIIYADRVTAEQVQGILRHEHFVHGMLKTVVGPQEFEKLLRAVEQSMPEAVADIRSKYGNIYGDNRSAYSEEVLAALAENPSNLNGAQRSLLESIADKIRQYLRKFVNIELSSKEIIDSLSDAYGRLRQRVDTKRENNTAPRSDPDQFRADPKLPDPVSSLQSTIQPVQDSTLQPQRKPEEQARPETNAINTINAASQEYTERKVVEKKVSETTKKGITPEAKRLIKAEGVPFTITKNLRRIAKENGIEITKNTRPGEILDALELKQKGKGKTITKMDEDTLDAIARTEGHPLQERAINELTLRVQKIEGALIEQVEGVGVELQDAIRRAGGIIAPSVAKEKKDPLHGEIKRLFNFVNKGKGLTLFRKAGAGLDRMAEVLRGEGFEFDTPRELIDALETSLSGRPFRAPGTIKFKLSEAQAARRRFALPEQDPRKEPLQKQFNDLVLDAVAESQRPKKSAGGIGLPEETRAQMFVRKVQNSLNRLDQVVNIVRQDKEILEIDDPALQAELMIGKASNRVDEFRTEVYDHRNKQSLLSRVGRAGFSMEQFGRYLHAKHALERNEYVRSINSDVPDGGSGMSDQQATRVLDEFGATQMEEFAVEFHEKVTQPRLDVLAEGGLITKELAEKLGGFYKFYVPLVVEKDAEGSVLTKRRRAPSLDPSIEFTEGSLRKRKNPVVTAIAAYEDAVTKTERNKWLQKLAKFFLENPDDAWEVSPEITLEGDRDVEGNLLVDIGRGAPGTVDPLSLGAAERDIGPLTKLVDTDFVVKVFFNGKARKMQFTDPALVRGISGLGMDRGIPVLSEINRYLRAVFINFNPEFWITNFERDIQTALVHVAGETKVSKTRVLATIPSAMRGIWRDIRGKEPNKWSLRYRDLKARGGKVGWFDFKSLEDKKSELEAIVKNVDKRGIRPAIRSFFDFVDNTNEAVESAVRLVVYDALLESGTNADAAASFSKNVTVNFNKKGELGTFINSIWLFSNASIQGSTRLIKGLKKSKLSRAIAGGLVMAGFIEEFMLQMFDDENEDYKKISDWDRNTNWSIPLGDGDRIKIALPYGYNVFKALGNSGARMFLGHSTAGQETGRMLGAINDSFNPLGQIDTMFIPTVAQPFEQILRNVNAFGSPVRPEQPAFAAYVPNSELYFDNVSKGSLAISQFMNENTRTARELLFELDGTRRGLVDISPENIDQLTEFFGGGALKFGVNSFETANSLLKGELPELNRIPFVRRFGARPWAYAEMPTIYDMLNRSGIDKFNDGDYRKFNDYIRVARGRGALDRERAEQLKKTFSNNQKKLRRKLAKDEKS